MAKQTTNNLKLGAFVLSGMIVIIYAMYMIGAHQNIFGSTILLKARFKNIGGLIVGNNVRFSGIQAGTVNKISIIDDTTMEISMLIYKKVIPYIKKNDLVDIGNEGLMGNKVVNISPNPKPAPPVEEGDLLLIDNSHNTAEMFQTLGNTNTNAEIISQKLIQTIDRFNNSAAIWTILNDTSLPYSIKSSLANIKQASIQANDIAGRLHQLALDMQNGKGTAGVLLSDTAVASNFKDAVTHITKASKEADSLIQRINSITSDLQANIDHGNGTAHALLKDSTFVIKFRNSLNNIEKGTAAFDEDMEALKHNFLTRRYFRKEAEKKKQSTDTTISND